MEPDIRLIGGRLIGRALYDTSNKDRFIVKTLTYKLLCHNSLMIFQNITLLKKHRPIDSIHHLQSYQNYCHCKEIVISCIAFLYRGLFLLICHKQLFVLNCWIEIMLWIRQWYIAIECLETDMLFISTTGAYLMVRNCFSEQHMTLIVTFGKLCKCIPV